MPKRKVEVFAAGCPVCDQTVNLVKSTACPNCDVAVYDLNKGCATNQCRDKAKAYGIQRLPAVVVAGQLLDCCCADGITREALTAAGVGRG